MSITAPRERPQSLPNSQELKDFGEVISYKIVRLKNQPAFKMTISKKFIGSSKEATMSSINFNEFFAKTARNPHSKIQTIPIGKQDSMQMKIQPKQNVQNIERSSISRGILSIPVPRIEGTSLLSTEFGSNRENQKYRKKKSSQDQPNKEQATTTNEDNLFNVLKKTQNTLPRDEFNSFSEIRTKYNAENATKFLKSLIQAAKSRSSLSFCYIKPNKDHYRGFINSQQSLKNSLFQNKTIEKRGNVENRDSRYNHQSKILTEPSELNYNLSQENLTQNTEIDALSNRPIAHSAQNILNSNISMAHIFVNSNYTYKRNYDHRFSSLELVKTWENTLKASPTKKPKGIIYRQKINSKRFESPFRRYKEGIYIHNDSMKQLIKQNMSLKSEALVNGEDHSRD